MAFLLHLLTGNERARWPLQDACEGQGRSGRPLGGRAGGRDALVTRVAGGWLGDGWRKKSRRRKRMMMVEA